MHFPAKKKHDQFWSSFLFLPFSFFLWLKMAKKCCFCLQKAKKVGRKRGLRYIYIHTKIDYFVSLYFAFGEGLGYILRCVLGHRWACFFLVAGGSGEGHCELRFAPEQMLRRFLSSRSSSAPLPFRQLPLPDNTSRLM